MTILRRSALLVAAAFLLWRIGVSGMSSYYAELLNRGEDDAVQKVLAWDGRQPKALYRQAIALRHLDPKRARVLLARAYAQNPTDTQPLMAAAGIALSAGEKERADGLVKMAVRLMPASPRIHQQAARYWVLRDDLEQAMRQWSLAIEADPAAEGRLFPLFLELAEDPRTQRAFEVLTDSPPSWWDSFFAEVAKRAKNVDTIRLLYSLRRQSWQVPITEAERKSYVARLEREGLTAEAYLVWLNALTPEQRRGLGLLYDGDFELEPGGWGFDWHLRSSSNVLVDRESTHGSQGNKSLHLVFERGEDPFEGVSQALFLAPGTYRLSGNVRTDSLRTQGGLEWIVRCLRPDVGDLGESPRFLGSNKWRKFELTFRVSESCRLQEIRLVSVGDGPREQRIRGSAWFDQMTIHRVPGRGKVKGSEVSVASFLRIEGEILIDKATRYIPAREGASLNVGDRLFVLEGSQAVIRFSDGCTHLLGENQIFTLAGHSTCALGSTSDKPEGLDSSGAASTDRVESRSGWTPPDAATISAVAGDALDMDSNDGDEADLLPIDL